MDRLNYDTLKALNSPDFRLEKAPEKVIQFGEGNFLRGFVDYFFDLANEAGRFNGKITVVQPIAQGLTDFINEQQGLYTLYLRGMENGQAVNRRRLISSIGRCFNPYVDFDDVLRCAENPELRYVVSNTTEAGIAYDPACAFEDSPPASFPAKLTLFLYERYLAFAGEKEKGLVILSCELIDNNGKELERCVKAYAKQWELEPEFTDWLDEACLFCSTLVDRIVTGYPRADAQKLNAENNYEDKLLDTAEVFGLWVIEGPKWLEQELPICGMGLPIVVTPDHTPYKTRKVRILNGAHTSMVLGAFLAGQDIVRDCVNDPVIGGFMEHAIYKEIIPTLTLPESELLEFAGAVRARFANPYIDHALLSIALNSVSKWKARILPTVKAYFNKFGTAPQALSRSLAFLLAFYHGDSFDGTSFTGTRDGKAYPIADEKTVVEFFYAHRDDPAAAYVRAAMENTAFWGEDLTALPGLYDTVLCAYHALAEKGAYAVMQLDRCAQ